jgi:hypothetical protein
LSDLTSPLSPRAARLAYAAQATGKDESAQSPRQTFASSAGIRCAISRLWFNARLGGKARVSQRERRGFQRPGDLYSIGFGKGREVLGGYRLSNAQRVNPGDSGRGGAEVRLKALGLWQQGVILVN